MHRHLGFIASLALLTSCVSGTDAPSSDPDPLGGKADGFARTIDCRSRGTEPVRATRVTTPDPDLVASGDIPLPSYEPDADGYFHPPLGYIEGGTYAQATELAGTEPRADEIRSSPEGAFVRMATWNASRGNELTRLIRRMREMQADIWILNEVDMYGHNSGGVVTAREAARALGYSYCATGEFYELREDRRGMSGNAIVSRFPLYGCERIDLPILPEEGGDDWADSGGQPRCGQRSTLAAYVDLPTQTGEVTPVRIVSAHFENKSNSRVRRAQLDAARELCTMGEPCVLAGDFNTISIGEGSALRRRLQEEVQELGPQNAFTDCSHGDDTATFGIFPVLLRIDWFLLQAGQGDAIGCLPGSYSVEGAGGASDHRLIVTDVFVRGDTSAPDAMTE